MMLVVSPQDFQKLSPACRAELIQLLMRSRQSTEGDFMGALAEPEINAEVEEVINDEKTVVNLSVSEAKNLLANLKKSSAEILRHFALGHPVPLDALVGENKTFVDYALLKRTFVGAVNRRLRTVSGNRNAALFSSDRDKTLIKVTPQTARSLRRVFNMPEPLPALTYCDGNGEDLDSKNPECQALQARLAAAWGQYDSTGISEKTLEFHSTVLKHLVASGFELRLRVTVSWDQDRDIAIYEIQTVSDPLLVIENWRTAHHSDEIFVGLPGDASVLAQLNN